jgi:hypothetical protein
LSKYVSNLRYKLEVSYHLSSTTTTIITRSNVDRKITQLKKRRSGSRQLACFVEASSPLGAESQLQKSEEIWKLQNVWVRAHRKWENFPSRKSSWFNKRGCLRWQDKIYYPKILFNHLDFPGRKCSDFLWTLNVSKNFKMIFVKIKN